MEPTRDESPLWRQIADQLRSDIADEVYAPGSALPGETVMAQRYQTSRPTVRRAIAELAGEGLLSAAHGRGTFVRPRPDRRAILIGGADHPDFLDPDFDPTRIGWQSDEHPAAAQFSAAGIQGVTDAVITAADRDQAEALGIKTGQVILFRFQHWRHRQTQRVISVTSAAPSHLLGILDDPNQTTPDPNLFSGETIPYPRHEADDHHTDPSAPRQAATEPLGEPSPSRRLYDMLAVHGPVSFTTNINARMPRGDELNDLGIEPGTPVLQIRRTMTDQHGRPLEYTLIEASSDRFEAITADPRSRTPGAILAV